MLLPRFRRPPVLPLRDVFLLALAIAAGLAMPAGTLADNLSGAAGENGRKNVTGMEPEGVVRVSISEPAPVALLMGFSCFGALLVVKRFRKQC